MLLDGELTIHFCDGKVDLKPGEMFVVPKGVEHCPEYTKLGAAMVIEPAGTVNTGDAGGDFTEHSEEWI